MTSLHTLAPRLRRLARKQGTFTLNLRKLKTNITLLGYVYYLLFNTFDDDAGVLAAEPAEECWYSHLEEFNLVLFELVLFTKLSLSRIQHKQIDADAIFE